MRVGSREERDHWIAAFKDAIAAANKEVAKPPAGAVNKDVSEQRNFNFLYKF